MLPNPWYTPLERFAGQACLTLEARGMVPQLIGEDWKTWGASLGFLRSPGERPWPDPSSYTDWREWATALISSIADAEGG